MKRTYIILAGLAVLGVGGMVVLRSWRERPRVSHQLPYKWDSYVQRDLHFEMAPMVDVIAQINAAIREASKGVVPEAIKLDPTPTQIVKVSLSPELAAQADELIATFRQHEEELSRQGACGFERTPFTGTVRGDHSLFCQLGMAGGDGLRWEPKEDALHVARSPERMECRSYPVTDALLECMKRQQSSNKYYVGADPVASALIEVSGIRSWCITVPSGPNSWTTDFRHDKVFEYIPELKMVLALATPEEHVEAERRMRAAGLWPDSETGQAQPMSSPDPVHCAAPLCSPLVR